MIRHLAIEEERGLISLVGWRCIQCSIEDVQVEAMWDTGTEVSLILISESWLKAN